MRQEALCASTAPNRRPASPARTASWTNYFPGYFQQRQSAIAVKQVHRGAQGTGMHFFAGAAQLNRSDFAHYGRQTRSFAPEFRVNNKYARPTAGKQLTRLSA
jgi:hypothetical protein